MVIPTKSSLWPSQLLREVKVIEAEKISQAPAHSLPELLTHSLGVDIRQRGAAGVQADLGIRGSNFEQTLICVNGVRLNDPQTGHHNLDLPVTLMDIERIEILPGQGSSLYGPGAFGGVVNIVTKKPEKEALEIESGGGSFGLNQQALSLSYPLGTFSQRLSFSRQESSGYRPDTEFDFTSVGYNAQKEFSSGALEYLFGYTAKDFGADSFYSNLYPHEEEHTDTRFFNLKAHIKKQILAIQSNLYFRRHSDHYMLDRNRPGWNENYHTSYSYGGDLETYFEFPFGSLVFSSEVGEESITSTNLGSRSRDNQAVYSQFQSPLDNIFAYNLGLRLDHYQKWGWQASPALGLGYQLTPQLRFKTSGGHSFRIPSFTELYYQDRANIGNQNLTPEEAWSSETGLNFNQGKLNANLTYFQRWSEDLIEWVRASSSDRWQAQNISQVNTQGIELEFSLRPKEKGSILSQIHSGYIYQYLESESINLQSKYTLDFLKHHAFLGLDLLFPGDVTQNLTLSYKQRVDQQPYFLLDSRLSKKMEKDKFAVEVFLDVTNLLNTSYSEQADVAMPGRWLIAGMRVKL